MSLADEIAKKKQIAPREFRSVEDVLQYSVEVIDVRITDYNIASFMLMALRDNPEAMAAIPEVAKPMLRNTDAQIQFMQEARQFLMEQIIERRALASVSKVTGEQP